MTTTRQPASKQPASEAGWYARPAEDAAAQLGVDPDQGLGTDAAQQRLTEYGPNEIPTEPPPSVWMVARGQLANPMNIMLLIVCAASFAIGQVATGVVVFGLVAFNVVMGTNQEMKARASVEALAKMQVPHARVRRSGQVEEIESTKLVPGDIVLLEAGDVVPADGRIITSATLDAQRFAAHFGEIGRDAPVIEVSGRTYPVDVRYRAPQQDEDDGVDEEKCLVLQRPSIPGAGQQFLPEQRFPVPDS